MFEKPTKKAENKYKGSCTKEYYSVICKSAHFVSVFIQHTVRTVWENGLSFILEFITTAAITWSSSPSLQPEACSKADF